MSPRLLLKVPISAAGASIIRHSRGVYSSTYCAAHSFTVLPPQCKRIGYTEPGIIVHIRKSNPVLDGTQIESVDLVFFGFALGSQPFQMQYEMSTQVSSPRIPLCDFFNLTD